MTKTRFKRSKGVGFRHYLFALVLALVGGKGVQAQDLNRLGDAFLDNQPLWYRGNDSAVTGRVVLQVMSAPSWRTWTALHEGAQNIDLGIYGPPDYTMSELMEYEPGPLVTAAALINRGNIALRRAEYGRARLYYSQAITEASRERSREADDLAGTALYSIAYAHVIEGDQPAGRTAGILRDVLDQYPGNPRERDALYLLGELTREQGNCTQALLVYDRIIDAYPVESTFDARNRKAYCLALLGRFQEARDLLDSTERSFNALFASDTLGLNLLRIQAENRLLLGEMESLLGNFPAAESAFLPLLSDQGSPYRRQGLLGLASTYQTAGRNDSALALYSQILAEDTLDAVRMRAQFNAAIVHRRLGDTSEANGMMRAMAADTAHAMSDRASIELGITAYVAGDYVAADSAFTRAARHAGNAGRNAGTFTRAMTLLGVTRLAEGNVEGAVHAFETAENVPRTSPEAAAGTGSAEARLLRGITLARVGRGAEAIPVLNRFLEQYPTHAAADQATYWLGEAYYQSGLYKAAADAMSLVLESYPGSPSTPDALYALGWAQLKAQKFDKAEAAFAQLVKAYPLSAYAAEAQLRRGDALYLQGRYGDAAAAYGLSARFNPTVHERAYAGYQIALAEYRGGRLAESDTLFEQFATCYAGQDLAGDALYMRGEIALRTGRLRDAVALENKYLAAYGRDEMAASAFMTIAEAYARLGERESARAAYSIVTGRFGSTSQVKAAREAADELNDDRGEPGDDRPACTTPVRMAMERARLYRAAGRARDAALEHASLDAARLSDECVRELWLEIGRTHLALGDTARAVDTLRLVVERFPRTKAAAAAMQDLGVVEGAMGRRAEAIAYLERVREEQVDSSLAIRATLDLARLLAADGRRDTARVLFGAVIAARESDECTAGAWIGLARMENDAAVLDSIGRQLALIGERDDSLGTAALLAAVDIRTARGNYNEAATLLEGVVLRSRGDLEFRNRMLLWLGDTYERLGAAPKARKAYEDILRRACSDSSTSQAGERLARMKNE